MPDAAARKSLLEVWLAELADNAHGDARGTQKRHWQFFDQLAANGGTCRASEWETYFTRQPNLSTAVTALEQVNLLVRGVDPDNATRAMANITPLGWLVYFNRNRYGLPSHTSLERDGDSS